MTCPACAITSKMCGSTCTDHAPPNPWAGRHPCPTCGSAEWTLPAEVYVPGTWRCCSCSVAWVPAVRRRRRRRKAAA